MPDILSAQHEAVWMGGLGVNAQLDPVDDQPHLFAPRGFLDDTWWHRTYWIYGVAMRGGYTGWPQVGNVVPAGRLLVYDGGDFIYGYGRMSYREGDGHVGVRPASGYKLFAEQRQPEPQMRQDARGEKKIVPGRRKIQWTAQLPFVARAMLLTRDALVVAGGDTTTDDATHHGPGTLWLATRSDGARRYAVTLPATPVLDGLALTDAGLFVAGLDGSIVCLRSSHRP